MSETPHVPIFSPDHLLIPYRGDYYRIDRFPGELDEHLQLRSRFIVRRAPKTSEEYQEAVRLSRFYLNWKTLNCEYDAVTMAQLAQHE